VNPFFVKYETCEALIAAGLTPEQAESVRLPAAAFIWSIPTAEDVSRAIRELGQEPRAWSLTDANEGHPEDWVSLREFARRIGVVPNAVQQEIESGRIERRADKKIHWPSQSRAFRQSAEHQRLLQAKFRKAKAEADLAALRASQFESELALLGPVVEDAPDT